MRSLTSMHHSPTRQEADVAQRRRDHWLHELDQQVRAAAPARCPHLARARPSPARAPRPRASPAGPPPRACSRGQVRQREMTRQAEKAEREAEDLKEEMRARAARVGADEALRAELARASKK